MIKIKQSTVFTLLVVLVFAVLIYLIGKDAGWFEMRAVRPPIVPDGIPPLYQSFPLGTLAIYLKDASNPTLSVVTSTINGMVYSIDTSRTAITSPITPYLDSDVISTSTGALEFGAKRIMTANSYWVKIWDKASVPAWYPELISVTVPALDPALGAAATYTASDVYLSKIGTFADPMTVEATGAGGGSLQTGVTSNHAQNKVTISVSGATDTTITIRFTITLANTGVGTKLKNVVLRPVQDTAAPMPTTAFTAATLSHVEGTNFNVPSNILAYVSGQTPISLGDWTDATSARYYLQVSLDKPSLAAGQKFFFRLDDLGNWLAVDDIAGQSGATSVGFSIEVVA